jgi:radical SAM protein with 4Fe4S-binding SPASM domain
MMDFTLFQHIIDQSYRSLLYLLLYFQGEPFLHPAFFRMIEYASSKHIFTASSTNGHFLSEKNAERTVKSGLDKLIISVDGTTQEIYEKYRKGGRLDTVLSGIKNLIHARQKFKSKTPLIVIQFIVFKHNEHQINDFKMLAKSLGVDKHEIKTAQIYDYHLGSELIPDITKYARYSKTNNGYKIKSELPNYCRRMWHSSVITQSGQLVPCCFDKQAEHSFGDINQYASVSDAFHSDKAKAFRTKLFMDRKSIDICSNCTEGLKG